MVLTVVQYALTMSSSDLLLIKHLLHLLENAKVSALHCTGFNMNAEDAAAFAAAQQIADQNEGREHLD